MADRATRVIPIHTLSRGMTLTERSETGKRKETPVKKVVLSPEGCRHSVHVNDNACYPRQSYVTVTV